MYQRASWVRLADPVLRIPSRTCLFTVLCDLESRRGDLPVGEALRDQRRDHQLGRREVLGLTGLDRDEPVAGPACQPLPASFSRLIICRPVGAVPDPVSLGR